jgi:hypothetical protein
MAEKNRDDCVFKVVSWVMASMLAIVLVRIDFALFHIYDDCGAVVQSPTFIIIAAVCINVWFVVGMIMPSVMNAIDYKNKLVHMIRTIITHAVICVLGILVIVDVVHYEK